MLIGILSGIFLEYFDYSLYAFSAPYIAYAFFPSKNPAIELMLTWAVFSISFLFRPIGAVIFGHLADRMGRRHILIITILLMSFSTMAIGFLPTYHQVGMITSIALLACRIIQGLSVSTEYSGSSTYLLEFKRTHPGFMSGIITSASGFGIFFASLLVLSFHSMETKTLFLDNWRWPFIIAGVIVGFLGFFLRLGLSESPDFLIAQQRNEITRFPLWKLIQSTPRALIKGIIISAYAGIAIIVIEVYLPTYLQFHLKMQKETALQLSTYLALIEAFFAILWGFISDYFGRMKTIAISGIFMIIGIFPLIELFHFMSLWIWFTAATLLAIIVAAVDGPMAAFLTSSFSTETRYTGVSISYNLGAAVMGGLSPSILLLLPHQTSLTWYLIISAVVMLIALILL